MEGDPGRAGPPSILIPQRCRSRSLSGPWVCGPPDPKWRARQKEPQFKPFPSAKSLSHPLGEFTRRFLLHVLPKGFVRIRYYGFLANAGRARLLARCRLALGQIEDSPVEGGSLPDEALECILDLLPQHTRLCARCGKAPLRCTDVLARPPPIPHPWLQVAA